MLVDPELLEIFRGYHAQAKGEFVIESVCPPILPRSMTITAAKAICRI